MQHPADAESLRAVLDALHTAVIIAPPELTDATSWWVNRRFTELSGVAPEGFPAGLESWLVGAADLLMPLRSRREPAPEPFLVQAKLADGRVVHWQIRATGLPAPSGQPCWWLLECQPAGTDAPRTSLELSRTQGRLLSREDPVTGVLSEAWFTEMGRHQLASAKRKVRTLSLMYFVVESFEEYVATFGPQAGDNCLRLVAHRIGSNLRRATDLLARVDRHAFAALAEDMAAEPAHGHMLRIQQAVDALRIHNPRSTRGRFISIRTGLRIGAPAPADSFEGWLAEARQAAAEGVGPPPL